MASRLSLLIDFLAYQGSETNDPADAIKVKNKSESDQVTEITRISKEIPDGTLDQTVNIATTSTYLIILVDQACSIKLNGSLDSLNLAPAVSGKKAVAFVCKGDVTALSVSNASGSTLKLDVISAQA